MPKIQKSTKKSKNPKTGKESKADSYWITIPSDVITMKDWKQGTVLEFKEFDGRVYLIEVR